MATCCSLFVHPCDRCNFCCCCSAQCYLIVLLCFRADSCFLIVLLCFRADSCYLIVLLCFRADSCFRCVVIHEKHRNVLQYKESKCTVFTPDYIAATDHPSLIKIVPNLFSQLIIFVFLFIFSKPCTVHHYFYRKSIQFE